MDMLRCENSKCLFVGTLIGGSAGDGFDWTCYHVQLILSCISVLICGECYRWHCVVVKWVNSLCLLNMLIFISYIECVLVTSEWQLKSSKCVVWTNCCFYWRTCLWRQGMRSSFNIMVHLHILLIKLWHVTITILRVFYYFFASLTAACLIPNW